MKRVVVRPGRVAYVGDMSLGAHVAVTLLAISSYSFLAVGSGWHRAISLFDFARGKYSKLLSKPRVRPLTTVERILDGRL